MMNKLAAPSLPKFIKDQLPTNIRRYSLKVDNHLMHLMEYGPADGYPLLLVHGNPTWGFLYRKVITALPVDTFRCIMPDLIGLGFSSKPNDLSIHTLANHAHWQAEMLRQLALPEVIFVGQDWGGAIGVHALRQVTDQTTTKGMVVLNTALAPPKPSFRPTTFHKFSRMPLISTLAFRLLGFPQNGLHRVQGNPDSIKGEVAKAYKYPLKGFSNNAAPLAMARMVPNSLEHPSIKQLAEVKAFVEAFSGPAAIIWGMNDPVLRKLFKRTARLLPQATTLQTQGGHFVQEENEQEIAQAIVDVYQKIQATT